VAIVAGDQVVAQHTRSYARGVQVLDPRHYLVTLQRRPAALDHAPVYRDWHLPERFGQLRSALEARHGPAAGVRHFIRVLQLLAEHPQERIDQAIQQCYHRGLVDAERIRSCAELLATKTTDDSSSSVTRSALTLLQVQVPLPDLSHFNRLLMNGAKNDVPIPDPVDQSQPEAVTPAHHGCGV
jgi:hypothetical protein